MSKENKYYTPSIEEFHIGFEYEYYIATTGLWHDQSIVFIEDFEEIEEYLSYNKIRVKYLDQEDIKSLGWEYQGKNGYMINKKYWLDFFEDDNCNICIEEGSSIGTFEGDEVDCIFRGFCKNKNELKKVLQMLGIL